MSEVILKGHELRRSFQSGDKVVSVLDSASIELCDKDFGLLMGPSGSGKSTLLAVLSGLLRPEQGEVEVLGTDLLAMNDAQRRKFRLDHFGFVFQGYNLFPALTAREQLEIVGHWGGRGWAGRRPEKEPTVCSSSWGWRTRPTSCPRSCPVARSSGWPSAGRS